ncbi:hypothetical protein D3C80_972540 [compost metagenome]
MDHLALDGEGAAQDGGGAIHVPGLQRLAHGGRRQFQARGVVDAVGDRDGEAQGLAIDPQRLGRAGTALAEGEVEADGGVGDAQTFRQDAAGEILVAHPRHLGVEGDQIQTVDAQRGQGAGHLVRRHQAKRRGLGLEQAARMRVEADDGQGRAQTLGGGAGRGDDRLMAPMHPVKGADGHRRPALRGRQVAPAADDLNHL